MRNKADTRAGRPFLNEVTVLVDSLQGSRHRSANAWMMSSRNCYGLRATIYSSKCGRDWLSAFTWVRDLNRGLHLQLRTLAFSFYSSSYFPCDGIDILQLICPFPGLLQTLVIACQVHLRPTFPAWVDLVEADCLRVWPTIPWCNRPNQLPPKHVAMRGKTVKIEGTEGWSSLSISLISLLR